MGLKTEGRNQTSMKSNVMEAISLVNGYGGVVSESNEDGVVRMKIVVRKEDLKQMIEAMRGSCNKNAHPPSTSPSSSVVERRLNLLKIKHYPRVNIASKNKRIDAWRPVLQSIPEDL